MILLCLSFETLPGVCITVEGKRHLGAALGTPSFIASFVNEKVSLWKKELTLLSDISVT